MSGVFIKDIGTWENRRMGGFTDGNGGWTDRLNRQVVRQRGRWVDGWMGGWVDGWIVDSG